MSNSDTSALSFLQTRRSFSLPTLQSPGPGRNSMRKLLEVASRVPDHGRMEPWRFVIPGTDTLADLAELAQTHGTAAGIDPEKLAKSLKQFTDTPRVVVVIGSPKPSDKIPEIEQTLAVGAVCVSLVNAALASGWGAVWLSNWLAHDRAFGEQAFGLEANEWVAGLIHIGTPGATPMERPRPDVEALTKWLP